MWGRVFFILFFCIAIAVCLFAVWDNNRLMRVKDDTTDFMLIKCLDLGYPELREVQGRFYCVKVNDAIEVKDDREE